MRPHQRINSQSVLAITIVLSLPLLAIIVLILLQKPTVFIALVGLIWGLASPGLVPLLVLEDFFHFLINSFLKLAIGIITPLIPLVIFVFSFYTKKKKRTTFLGLFILFYTLYGALALVLLLMGGS
jgi:hypothetical protein